MFASNAGLPARDPQKIFVNGVNPGMPDCQDESESALDVEWAGAIAKNATIDFVTAPSGATDGVVLAGVTYSFDFPLDHAAENLLHQDPGVSPVLADGFIMRFGSAAAASPSPV